MKKKAVRLLIWLVLISFLPMSLAITPTKAQAAKSKKTQTQTQETPVQKPIKLLKVSSPDKDKIYFDGQKITLIANYGRDNLKVTANLSMIDRDMPSNFPLEGKKGIYTLVTPALSAETMIVGQNRPISLIAEDPSGQIVTVRKAYLINVQYQASRSGSAIKKPMIVSQEAGDEQVKIAWEPVNGAKSYLVLYRDHLKVVRQIKVMGGSTSVVINNLQNNYTYQFSVAGKDIRGSKGPVSSIILMPAAPVIAVKAEPVEPVLVKVIPPTIACGTSIAATSEVKKEETKKEETPTQVGEKKEEQPQPRNWNRLLVAISILIIAAGAAIGGYYGYEWWLSKKEESPKETKTKSSNRW